MPLFTRRFLATASLAIATMLTYLAAPDGAYAQSGEMIVRIAEIELEAPYVAEYTTILKEAAATSVRLEPGVLSIFPMFEKEHPTHVRILEIYASRAAYDAHLKTPHFLEYKTTTLKMVKSLKLIDMTAIDAESMPALFRKMQR